MRKKLTFFLLSFTFIALSAQKREVSFLFAGDAMQHKSQLDAAKTTDGIYDYSKYFTHLQKEIEDIDIAVVNLEVTLPGKNYTGYPCFGAPDSFAQALKEAGFDIFLTANNHCLDKGKKGLERTIEVLDSMKVKHTGTFVNEEKRDLYYPLMMIKNGIRIAMLNYTYGMNGFTVTFPNIVNEINKKQIQKDINLAKQMKADIIIANMHWGDEYKLYPNKSQKDMANFLIENGVRLVIGGHPHVVQPIDIRKNEEGIESVIVYSMGNFISGMKPVDTMGGLMAKINISKEGDAPVKIDTCNYSLVWVHKLMKNKIPYHFELIPVSLFDSQTGKEYMGDESYNRMQLFKANATKAVESMWDKN